MKAEPGMNIFTPMFTAALFKIAKGRDNPNVNTNGQMNKQKWHRVSFYMNDSDMLLHR